MGRIKSAWQKVATKVGCWLAKEYIADLEKSHRAAIEAKNIKLNGAKDRIRELAAENADLKQTDPLGKSLDITRHRAAQQRITDLEAEVEQLRQTKRKRWGFHRKD
jgi:DNA repair exonuclease SbcCD ATPase subunit